MITGHINRTVKYEGFTINCRDPYGLWDVEGFAERETTLLKAKQKVDAFMKEAADAKAASAKTKVSKTVATV